MKDPANRMWSSAPVPGAHDPVAPLGSRSTGGGFGVLPFVGEPTPGAPATNASWAWSVRRFARAAVWLLPAYAILYGVVAMASDGGVGNDPYPANGRAVYLVGRVAAAGLLVSIAGTVLMLPFAGLEEQTPVFGTTARSLVLLGATFYSVGWF